MWQLPRGRGWSSVGDEMLVGVTKRGVTGSVLALALVLAACGGASPGVALPLAPTPAQALATCLKIRFMRSVCPRRVPLLSGRPTAVEKGCLDSGGSLVALASKRCRSALWGLEGAPPKPAPIGHLVILASLNTWQCTWPHEHRARAPNDRLLAQKRRHAVSLGQVRWYGQSGQLVLAPPYFAGGGAVGDHLAFCFRTAGVNYAITLHSWAPVTQVIATLKRLVGSALRH